LSGGASVERQTPRPDWVWSRAPGHAGNGVRSPQCSR
jgi:hypothetical protein